jgi:hypothetical protein
MRACHIRKLLLVNGWDGGLPKAAAKPEDDEEELMFLVV